MRIMAGGAGAVAHRTMCLRLGYIRRFMTLEAQLRAGLHQQGLFLRLMRVMAAGAFAGFRRRMAEPGLCQEIVVASKAEIDQFALQLLGES